MGRRPSAFVRSFLLAACACAPGLQAEAAPGAKAFVYASPVGNMDPALGAGPDDERLVLACFEGLTSIDPSTGQPRPAAAEKIETSADGKTWTFTLRKAQWQKKFGDAFETKGDVKASDFVYAWKRLFDPEIGSPHIHLLDGLAGVTGLSVHKPRADALDRIVSELDKEIGGKSKKTLTADQVQAFLDDTGRNARHWLGELGCPEAKEILAWPSSNAPYQGLKSTKLIEALSKEREKSLGIATEADGHVGVDRGFFAKDDRTLVVQTLGPAPWLPSLVSRSALVPVHQAWTEKRHDQAFNRRESWVVNGAFVCISDVKITKNQTNEGGELTPFKVVLVKNPAYWDAANVASDRITCIVNENHDELVRLYIAKEVHWIPSNAFSPDVAKGLRSCTAAGWKPDPKHAGSASWPAIAGDAYDSTGGATYILRFRCAPPFDKPEARRALASLVTRDALAAKAPCAMPPTGTKRFVPYPRTTGSLASVRTPTFEAAKAAALYGAKKFKDDASSAWIRVLAPSEDDQVADAITKAWKSGKIPDDAMTTVRDASDFRNDLTAGRYDAALGAWMPAFDDPLASLYAFTSKNPAGATQWSNAAYDALVLGAVDVAAFAANPPAEAKDIPSVKTALGSAKDAKGLEALRQTLLAEAESILLEEAVVVPLWQVPESGLLKPQVRGINLGGRVPRNILDVQPLPGVAYDG